MSAPRALLATALLAATALAAAAGTGRLSAGGPIGPARLTRGELDPARPAGLERRRGQSARSCVPVSEPLPGHPLTSVPPEERAARASVTCERRRVHGRLLWGGLPLPDRLVTFEQAGADPVQAWDLTGDQGDYDVLLSPGRYALALDGRPAPGLEVLVPPSPDEAQMKGLELDLILRRAPTPEDR